MKHALLRKVILTGLKQTLIQEWLRIHEWDRCQGNLVDRVGKPYGYDGDGIVDYPPFYTKVKNDKSKVYSGYEFFLKEINDLISFFFLL